MRLPKTKQKIDVVKNQRRHTFIRHLIDLGGLPKKHIQAIEELVRNLKDEYHAEFQKLNFKKGTSQRIVFRSKRLGAKGDLRRESIYDWLSS